jgi:guanylate kinase
LIERAVAEVEDLAFVPSVTTRPQRSGEREGEAYYFVDSKEFDRRLSAGQILEWQEFFANRYGTSRLHIEERLAHGLDAMTDVEVLGAYEILARLPLEACAIGVEPPNMQVLSERIAGRQAESPAQLKLRRQRAAKEVALLAGLDYIVVNDDLDTAVADLLAIVRAHASRRRIERRALAAGRRPIFRSIDFEIRRGNSGTVWLPASRLGTHETSRDALLRGLQLHRLRGGVPLALNFLHSQGEDEVATEKDTPFPYLELRRTCRLKDTSY